MCYFQKSKKEGAKMKRKIIAWVLLIILPVSVVHAEPSVITEESAAESSIESTIEEK